MFVSLLERSIDIVVSIYGFQLHLPLLWTFMLLVNFVYWNLGMVPIRIKKICEYCNKLDTSVYCFRKGILAQLHDPIMGIVVRLIAH